MRVVRGGVKPGENVVVDGLQRVIPGVPVQPQVLKVDDKGMPIFPPPPGPPGAPPARAERGERWTSPASSSTGRASRP